MEYDSNRNDPTPIGNCFSRFNNFISVDELNEIEQFSDARSSFAESDYESLSRQLNGINCEKNVLCEDECSCLGALCVSNSEINNRNCYAECEWLDFQEADEHDNKLSVENTCKQFTVLETLSEIFSMEPTAISGEHKDSLNTLEGDGLWHNLIKCDTTPALRFTWNGSHCRVKLINSLQLHPPLSLRQATPR